MNKKLKSYEIIFKADNNTLSRIVKVQDSLSAKKEWYRLKSDMKQSGIKKLKLLSIVKL